MKYYENVITMDSGIHISIRNFFAIMDTNITEIN